MTDIEEKKIYTISIKQWYSRKREEKETDVIINYLIKEDTLKKQNDFRPKLFLLFQAKLFKRNPTKTHLSKILK